MYYKWFGLVLLLVLINCKNAEKDPENHSFSKETSRDVENTGSGFKDSILPPEERAALAITSNALQLVDKTTGSSQLLAVGMEMQQLLYIVSFVLDEKPPKPQVNQECGAGPMTIVMWSNGLVTLFQPSKATASKMEFVGWSLSDRATVKQKPSSMAGIGIGSTRAQLEEVYTVKVTKTTLGQEFSTNPEGLFGILDGESKDSKINFMWSGLSCNFR